MADAYFSARFEDCFDLGSALSPEDVQVRQPIRKFVDAWVRPYAGQWWLEEKFPQDLVARLAQLGVFGPTLLEEVGGPGLSPISYGLMMQECRWSSGTTPESPWKSPEWDGICWEATEGGDHDMGGRSNALERYYHY